MQDITKKEETIIIVLNINSKKDNYLKDHFNYKVIEFLRTLEWSFSKTKLNVQFIIFVESFPDIVTKSTFTNQDVSNIMNSCLSYNQFISSFSKTYDIKKLLITCDSYKELAAKNTSKNQVTKKLYDILSPLQKHLIGEWEKITANVIGKPLEETQADVISINITKNEFICLYKNSLMEFEIEHMSVNKRKIFTTGTLSMKKIYYSKIKKEDLNFKKNQKNIIYLNTNITELEQILKDNENPNDDEI